MFTVGFRGLNFHTSNATSNSRPPFQPSDNSKQKPLPLSLPYEDSCGNKIQLWHTDQYGVFGSVLNKEGKFHLIPSHKILNPLDPTKQMNLARRLQALSLRVWHLAYDPVKLELTLWPELVAAGKLGVNGHKGHLTPSDLRGAWKEARGIPLEKTKADGTSYDHIDEVRNSQQGLLNIIDRNNRKLGKDNLPPDERACLTKEIAEASKWLDHSENWLPRAEKYVPHKPPNYEHYYHQPANKQFEQDVQQADLTADFNAQHEQNPIAKKGDTGKPIGGVACSSEYIQGLFDTPESLFENNHYFCLPNLPGGQLPFTNDELKQILRELATGIYVHSTIPFFSLHFNQDLHLFPIIHPAYRNTLVGKVISMLDYIMKGYLNGGIFEENFVQEWYEHPNWATQCDSALKQLIDFEEYCKKNLEGEDSSYVSLRTLNQSLKNKNGLGGLLEKLGVVETDADEPPILKDYTEFSNSFRIIAKQNSIQKEGNLFVIDAAFDVFDTISPSPRYKDAMDQFFRKHGRQPSSYLRMITAHTIIKERIHDHLPKLPLCQKYFSMLAVINFFCAYFSTLKKHRKFPLLSSANMAPVKGSPVLFPNLPIRTVRAETLQINMHQVFKNILKDHRDDLEKFMQDVLKQSLDEKMHRQKSYHSLVQTKEKAKQVFISKFFENLLSLTNVPLRRFLIDHKDKFQDAIQKQGESIIDEIEELIKSAINEVPSSKLNSMDYNGFIKSLLDQGLLKAFKDEKRDFIKESFDPVRLPSEMNDDEVKEGKRVVGGCGMDLKVQRVESSFVARYILQNKWSKLGNLELETLKTIKIDPLTGAKGGVFHLLFEDLSPGNGENYDFMENFLQIPQHNDVIDMANWSLALDLMSEDNQEGFKKLIQENKYLAHMQDKQGKTLLHHAATLPSIFYTELLLKSK